MEENQKPRIVNIGIRTFYDALVQQGATCVQIDWAPPACVDPETDTLLDRYL